MTVCEWTRWLRDRLRVLFIKTMNKRIIKTVVGMCGVPVSEKNTAMSKVTILYTVGLLNTALYSLTVSTVNILTY